MIVSAWVPIFTPRGKGEGSAQPAGRARESRAAFGSPPTIRVGWVGQVGRGDGASSFQVPQRGASIRSRWVPAIAGQAAPGYTIWKYEPFGVVLPALQVPEDVCHSHPWAPGGEME